MTVTKVKSKTKKHSNKFAKNGKNKSMKRNMSKRGKNMRGGSKYMRNANSIAAFDRKSKREAEFAVRRQLQEEIRQKRLAAQAAVERQRGYMEVSDVEEPLRPVSTVSPVFTEPSKSFAPVSPVSPSGYLKIGAEAEAIPFRRSGKFPGKRKGYRPGSGSETAPLKIPSL